MLFLLGFTFFTSEAYAQTLVPGATTPASISVNYDTGPGALQMALPTGGNGTYTYSWQKTTSLTAPVSWTPISGTTRSKSPEALTVTTYFQGLVTSNGVTKGSNIVTVTVYQQLAPGTISPVFQNINSNITPATLVSTPSTGGNGVYSYQWQSSVDQSTWTTVSTGSTYTPQAQTVSTYYRLVTTCGTASVISNTAFVNIPVSQSYSSSNNIVNVNELTGTANVIIPLCTIKAAHIDFPINLTYSATGVKATDMEGNAGMGWNVSLGGAVTRQLRGLPDDIDANNAGDAASGWLYANNPNISLLNFVNDNNPATCSDEGADISTIASDFPSYADTEPDIFQVNAPGLSCQLIFDNSGILRVSPYQDLKVSYTKGAIGNPDQAQITSFTITNDKGITYVFSATSTTTQTATTTLSNVNYFQSNYNFYKSGITYYSSWGLSSITDIHGNSIYISYTPGPTNNFTNPVQVSVGGGALTTEYTMTGSTTSQNVVAVNCKTSIWEQGQSFKVTYQTTPNSNQSIISDITGMGHDFVLGYNNVTSEGNLGDFTRLFLNSVIDQVCSAQSVNGQTVVLSSYAPLNLTFNYINTGSAATTTSSLATPSSYNRDYWGYTKTYNANITSLLPSIDINPSASTSSYERYRNKQVSPSPSTIYTYSITGANREADQDCTTGTLSQINYSAGGYTALSYAPNDYYDNTAQATVQGGGIRVTQVLDHDGISTDNDFIKSYTYRDASGNSTGKALSMPIFAFTTPYSGTNTNAALWNSSTIVSPVDLSGEDHSILYSAVTEMVNNTGSTVYHYSVPATNWDLPISAGGSTGLPAWSSTTVNVGRKPGTNASCQSVGVLRNDVNTYPFPPNINYDFERGLLTSVAVYNNSGTEVSETDYYYTTPETPVDIAALKYDVNSYATNYAKYLIHTGAAPLVTQTVNKVFDLTNVSPGTQPTASQTVTTNNTYNTAQHKLSQQVVQNSDGSVNTTHIKYVKDYGLVTAGDGYTTNLLVLQNDNLNIPIETYTQFTPIGSSQPLTTHAELVLFGTFPNQGITQLTGGGRIMGAPQPLNVIYNPGPAPLKHLTFNATYGVTDFISSSIGGANTSPSFQFDTRYIVTENDLGYDYAGALLSSNDGFNHTTTNLFDNLNAFRLRATINNASYDQIGMDYPETFFSTLDGYGTSPDAYNFTAAANTSISASSVARNGVSALTLPATQALTKVLNKNPQAQNYIFSIWVNTSSTGSFTVSLTDGTNSASKSFTFDATVGNTKYPTGFEYCQVSIPIGSLTASSTLTLNFSSNTAINFTDIMTYPDVANMTTYSYDGNQNKISSTDGNGVSTYYSYDALGRLTYVYDQDDNIIERKTYVNNNPAINSPPHVNLAWTIFIAWNSTFNQETISFTAPITENNSCTFDGDAIYTWNFGDGTTQSGPNLNSVGHTYTGNKGQQFTCTLTIKSPQNLAAPFSQPTVVTL